MIIAAVRRSLKGDPFMKNTITLRLLALLLLICMLLPMAVACKKDPTDTDDGDGSDFTLQFPEVNPDNGFDPTLTVTSVLRK